MDDREGRKILLLLKEQDRLLQCVGDTSANFLPEFAGGVLDILDFRQQDLIEFADFQLHHVEALCLKGNKFHPVTGDMKNCLGLCAVFWWKSGIKLVGQGDRLKFEIDRVQVRVQQRIRPLAHRRGLGIADHHTRQIVILRTYKCVIGNKRVFKLADVWLQLDPEPRILGFFGQLGRGHVGKVQLTKLDNAAGDDQAGILGGKPDLFAQAAQHIADHILLACQVLQVELARKADRCQLFDIYHIGFMANFGYRKRVVVQLHGNEFVGAFPDRAEETSKSAE